MENETLICNNCENKIDDSDEFCPYCGTIFVEDLNCINHKNKEAKGVCVICRKAFCKKCGGRASGIFLCDEHYGYEIYEGMVRIFGSSDSAQTNYVKSCLEQAGFHPFIYSRKASPISIGGADYTLFRASGEYHGRIINEIKVMVPANEVLEAEKIIEELDIED